MRDSGMSGRRGTRLSPNSSGVALRIRRALGVLLQEGQGLAQWLVRYIGRHSGMTLAG